MPQDAPGSLSRDQDADVLADVLNRTGYPSGSIPLPATRDALEKWKPLATRP